MLPFGRLISRSARLSRSEVAPGFGDSAGDVVGYSVVPSPDLALTTAPRVVRGAGMSD